MAQVRQWGRVLVRKIQGNRTVIQNPLEHLDRSGPSGTWRSCEPQEHVTSLKDQWARGSHRSRRTSLRCEINSHRHRPPSNRHHFPQTDHMKQKKKWNAPSNLMYKYIKKKTFQHPLWLFGTFFPFQLRRCCCILRACRRTEDD